MLKPIIDFVANDVLKPMLINIGVKMIGKSTEAVIDKDGKVISFVANDVLKPMINTGLNNRQHRR